VRARPDCSHVRISLARCICLSFCSFFVVRVFTGQFPLFSYSVNHKEGDRSFVPFCCDYRHRRVIVVVIHLTTGDVVCLAKDLGRIRRESCFSESMVVVAI
jgi:hypothetical protein